MPAPVFDYSKLFRQTGLTGLADLGATLDGRSIYDMPKSQPGNPYNGVYLLPGALPDSPISPTRIRGLLSPYDDDDDDKPKNTLAQTFGLLAASLPKPAAPMVLDTPAPQVHRPEAQPIAPVDFRVPLAPAVVPRPPIGVSATVPNRRRRPAIAP
jgi:hypothetical protein